MHNVIVGTAGHVDHGKTCLIKALTGVDTDRLKEEKKRGITIELGFADMPNDGDMDIGIIDVPGHEKFIKNMLAGIGGIDLVLLVVAADEGVMPQTVEHFEILKMLDIRKGIVVLTKTDLVDEEWLEIVREDILDHTKGSFLEGAPMLEVSSYTGKNIPELKELICRMVAECQGRREMPELLRIPVDRVFTIDGFGTVVTGTLIEGSLRVGDEVEIYPRGKTAKVRNIQVHGNMVDRASAGQRTAVNFSNLKKEDVKRGDVAAAKGSLRTTMMLDVRIDMFKDANRVLKSGSRLHLYYGSAEVLCKAVLLDREVLESGQSGYAQLRLEEEIAVKKGDRFILRFYSPLESIGGGMILDANPPKRKRFHEKTLEGLRIKEQGDAGGLLAQTLLEESKNQTPIELIAGKLGLTKEEALKQAQQLTENGTAVRFGETLFLHCEYIKQAQEKAQALLREFHAENPISPGMNKEELRSRLGQAIHVNNSKFVTALIKHLQEAGTLWEAENTVALSGFQVQYTPEQNKIRRRLAEAYERAGFEAPLIDDVLAAEKEKQLAKQMIEQMEREGMLVKLSYQYYIHKPAWERALALAKERLDRDGQLALADFRDALGTSRKYAVMLLDDFDERKITRMTGDVRVLYQGGN